jgi:hypothetical protein
MSEEERRSTLFLLDANGDLACFSSMEPMLFILSLNEFARDDLTISCSSPSGVSPCRAEDGQGVSISSVPEFSLSEADSTSFFPAVRHGLFPTAVGEVNGELARGDVANVAKALARARLANASLFRLAFSASRCCFALRLSSSTSGK